MKSWILGLVLAALPALGGQPVHPVALYTEFQQPPPIVVLQAIQNEVGAIMAPLAVQFDWRPLASAGEDAAVPELAVVRFKGRCDLLGLFPHSASSGALGWTHVSDGAVLPFTEVDCDVIRDFLQPGLICLRAAGRETAYGRAVGRVVAHELYHVFAKTQHHSARGVAKPSYTMEDLLSPRFRFTEHDGDELREVLNAFAPPGVSDAMHND